jgi:predicted deacetylase
MTQPMPLASALSRRYLPEIHDLYPGMAGQLSDLIGLFPATALGKIAFSIVPNWQDTQPLTQDATFAARLRALPGTPVLHGLTHSLGPDFMNWLMYGHDNRSEFARLSQAETQDRLDRGLAVLTEVLGQAPRWFCAPRWQQSRHLEPALAALGFRGCLTRTALSTYDGPSVSMPALNFDEGARLVKIALGAMGRRVQVPNLLRRGQPFRFVLHPDDLTRPATLREIRATLARMQAEGWQPMSLDQALEHGRSQP